MRSPRLLPILASLVLGALLAYWAYSQETVGVGYTVIRAEEGTPLPIASAIFQFRNEEGDLVSEAGIEAVEPIGWGRIFVDQGDTRTGVALANASLDPLTLDLVLRDADGLFVAQTTVPLGAQEQLPRFIDEFFRDLPPDYRLGSLTIRTQPPQRRVAAVTLRGSPNEHGESIFATLPVVDLDQQVGAEPPLGDSSLVFPHIGAGVVSALRTLSTQIILINPSETATLKGRIRLTSSQGTPLQLELEGTTDSDFPYELGPNQVFKGTLRSSGSALAGYAQVTVEEGNLLPSGTAIFQFRDGSGNVISEAGVGARAATDKARLFVDTVDTRTGVALASAGNDATTVRLELRDRSGFLLASSLREVPAEGHLALFVDEVFDTPAGFTGVLEIHSLVPVVPITLKLSQNRRGDSILTTLPIADLRRPPQSLERVVPQLAFGPGLSTRLILLSSWLEGTLELEQEQLTGQLLFAHSSGTLMQLALSGEVGGQFSYQVSRAGGRQLRPGNSATVETIELLECHFPFGCGPLIGNELSVYQGQQMLILAQVKDSAGEWRDDFNLTYKLSPDIGSVDVWGQVDGTESGFADLEVSHRDLKIEAVLKVVSVTSGSASENQGLSGVAQDGAGRLYLVGEGRHTILRSNSLVESPRIYAGSDNKPGFQNGPRLDSEFDQPAFLSYDHSQGRLYVSDAGNHRIRLVEPGAGGGVQTFAGRGQPGHRNGPGVLAEFNQPQGVARVRDFLWVVDSGNHVIRKVHLLSRVVQTVAGQAGSPGLQDGQGLEAQFNTPTGITVETRSASGPGGTGEGLSTISVIVADTGNGVLRRIDEQGQVQTIEVAASTNLGRIPAVSLTGIAPGFQSPLGVAVDPFGNQYISDQQSEEVWTLLSNGTLVRAAVPGSFSAPAGLLVSESGAVVVTDNDVTVRRLRYGQPEIESIQGDVDLGGGGVTVRGKNFAPETGVTVAGVKADELTVLDTRTLRVEIPSGLPSGRVALTVANRGGLAQSHLLIKPPSLAELAQGEITTVTGGKPFLEDGTLAARAALRGPSAATLDPDGHLFFSDTEHQQIRRIDAVTGIVTTVAGAGGLATDLPNPVGDGGPAKAALLSAPRGLALDTFGNLYFADEANDRIRKVDAVTGLIETVAGGGNSVPTELDPAGLGDGGPATEGRLAAPSGIWLDGQDNLLIADTGNHLIRKVSQQGLLSTVAGNGVPGFSGDEGSALEASLNGPTAVFGDRGQLYIADSLNHLIRQVDSEGTIFTVVGPGVSELLNDGFSFTTGGVLQSPRGLWVDNDGRLLIADTDNHRIRRFDPRLGTISTVAGTGIAGFSEDGAALETHLNRPAGVAVDGAGNLWVTDTGNDRVRRVSSQQISTLAGGEATEVGDSDPAIAAALGFSTAIALDSDNNAYISDYAHHRIRRVDASSRLINTAVGAGEAGDSGDGQTADQALLSSPAGLALDALGNLFFTDTDHHKVRRVDGLSQIISTVIQGDELSVIDPSFPRGIVFGVAGELFLADTGNHRILSADLLQQDLFLIAGTGERGVGPDIGAGPSVVFDTPYAVEVDLEGNLYIADSFNHRVRKVDTANGIVSTVAGNGTPGFGGDGGPAPQAQLHFPTGLFIDENRNLLIADSFNHRIRVVQLEAGIISTIVGGDTLGFSGDGGKASEARLNFPSSVRLDSNGNLLIADRNNHRIRAIKGPLSSIAGDPSPTRFLTKTASPDPVNAGDRLTYSLTLNNTTDRSLTNLRLVDALPETVTFVSAASTSGSCGRPDDQQQITCNLGNLGRNRQTVVTIEVNVKHSAAGTILTNSAICSSFQGEPDDCQATVNTRVRPADSADLAVTKQAPNQVYFPDPIPYVIKVTNHGPAVAKAATLVDTLPSGDLLTVASVESDHGNCSLNGERIDCELGVLAEDAVATVLIEMEPTESARSQVVGNRVEVSSTSKDFVLSDNTHFVSTRILPPRQGLFLEKSVSTKKASPGDTLVYSLKVTNFGPEAETSVEITDPLPPGVSLVSAIPGKGSCQSSIEGTLNQVRCSVGTLAKGESAGATVEVTVDQTTPDTILTNSASCRSDALGVQPCRSQEVHTAVRPRGCADLSLSVDSPSELLYDAEDPEDIVYTLNVANQGPSRVTDVRLTAVLPVDPLTGISEVSFPSAEVIERIEGLGSFFCFPVQDLQGLVTQLECRLGGLNEGGKATVEIVVTPNAAIAGRTAVSSFALTGNNDCDESDNSRMSLTRLLTDSGGPESDLSIFKSGRSRVRPGDPLTYSLSVINNGPTTASDVVVTDTLPVGIELVSITSTQGSCDQVVVGGSTQIACSLGILGNGQQAANEARISIKTTASETIPNETTITNEASCSSIESDPDGCFDAVDTDITQAAGTEADLIITKDVFDDEIAVGDTLIYSLELLNFGPDEAAGVVVTDALPDGVVFDADLSSPECVEVESQTIECSLPVLGNGDSSEPIDAFFEIAVLVLEEAFGATLTNTASCSSDLNDPDGCEDSIEIEVSNAQANLSMTKTASDATVSVGDQLTYTLHVNNSGPTEATNVIAVDTLPDELSFDSSLSSPECDEVDDQVIECEVAVLGNSDSSGPSSVDFSIVVEVLEDARGTTVENSASCSSDVVDLDGCEHRVTVEVSAGVADLSISKSASDDTVSVGSELFYTLDLSNSGPREATNVVVTDELPSGVAFLPDSSSEDCSEVSIGVVECLLDFLDAEDETSFDIAVEVLQEADETTLINTASCRSDEDDPDSCADATEVRVAAEADLIIFKDASDDPVSVGSELIYFLEVLNFGPGIATGVTVTDNLPDGVSFNSDLSSPECSEVESGTVECVVDVLGNGDTEDLSDAFFDIVVDVLPDAAGTTLDNTASCHSDLPDSDGCEDSIEVEVEMNTADLHLTKRASVGTAFVGGTLTYTLGVSNFGPGSAADIVVTDILPDGLSFDSEKSSSDCSEIDDQIIECTVDSLDSQKSASLQIVVDVLAEVEGSNVTNLASCTFGGEDPNGCQAAETIQVASGALNHSPEVNAGPDRTLEFSETARLQGAVSDPDGDDTAVFWTLLSSTTGDPGLALNGSTSLSPTVTAGNTATFVNLLLCASDAISSPVCDLMTVTVIPLGAGGNDPPEILCNQLGNQPAVAGAGPDISVVSGESVFITGSGFDPDNTPPENGLAILQGSSGPRPIVRVVAPGGVTDVVSVGGRWGLPDGEPGSSTTPIVVQDVNAVSFQIGDRANPDWAIGSVNVNSANPQTAFPREHNQLDVFCVGCNGPRPSMTILNWTRLTQDRPRAMVARVSLGVDATDPGTFFDDSNSILIEIWFVRSSTAQNRAPSIDAGADQTVGFGQQVVLQGSVVDPDGDPTTIVWTQVSGVTVVLEGGDTEMPRFTAPDEPAVLRFQLCATDFINIPRCTATTVTVSETGLTFLWEALDTQGLPIALDVERATVSFTPPEVSEETTIVLGLSAFDARNCGTRDRVNVTIRPSAGN